MSTWLRVGRRTVCLDTGRFSDEGHLRPLELKLLVWLLRSGGREVSVEDLLREVWGYTSTNTKTVFSTIYRLRQAIEVDPSAPRHLISTRDGYRWLQTHAAPPLPRRGGRRFGREQVLDELTLALGQPGAFWTVVGPPGIGKSRTVIEAAGRMNEALAGNVFYVDLEQARAAEQVWAAVAQQLGHAGGPERALGGLGTALLVLDEAEGCVEALAEQIPAWRALDADLRVLVGSRVATYHADERRLLLGPLPSQHARELLLDRSGLSADAPIDELLEALDGTPLTVELAARRLQTMSARALLARLSDPRVLSDKGGTRHSSLSQALAVSWSYLPPELRLAWAQLSVFPAPFDLAAAEAVLGGPGASSIATLSALVEHHLVWFDPAADQYGMPLSLRAYAAEHGESSEREAALRRHADHYTVYANLKREFSPAARAAARPHLWMAWSWALARREGHLTSPLVLALARDIGTFEASSVVSALEQTLQLPDPHHPGQLWFAYAIALMTVQRHLEAEPAVDSAIQLLKDDIGTLPVAMGIRAQLLLSTGRVAEAEKLCMEALSLCQDTLARLNVAMTLSWILRDQGRWQESLGWVEQMRGWLDTSPDPAFELWLTGERCRLAIDAGRLKDALDLARQGLALAQSRGRDSLEARFHEKLSEILWQKEGELDTALVYLSAALAYQQRRGMLIHETNVRAHLVELLLAAGQIERAQEHLTWLEGMASRTTMNSTLYNTACLRSDLALARGEFEQAVTFARQILEIPLGWTLAAGELRLALLARRSGQLEEASEWIERGIAKLGPTPAPDQLGPLLVERAAVLIAQGRLQEASHTLDRFHELLPEHRGELYGLACVLRAKTLWSSGRDGQPALDEAQAVLRGRTAGRLWAEISSLTP